MHPLVREVPDGAVLLAMSSEELGLHLLRMIIDNPAMLQNAMIHGANFVSDISQPDIDGQQSYPETPTDQVSLALREAWSWLERHGYLLPAEGINGRNGWRVLSRSAASMARDTKPLRADVGALLPKAALCQALIDRAWMPFMRGDYDVAILEAMKQVEIGLRDIAGDDGVSKTAVQVARMLLDTDRGVLSNLTAERSEREAAGHLYAGVLGLLKNPQSHRVVGVDDPIEASAVILFANFLLRDIARRHAASA